MWTTHTTTADGACSSIDSHCSPVPGDTGVSSVPRNSKPISFTSSHSLHVTPVPSIAVTTRRAFPPLHPLPHFPSLLTPTHPYLPKRTSFIQKFSNLTFSQAQCIYFPQSTPSPTPPPANKLNEQLSRSHGLQNC